ncbi:homoserine kinase [Paenibacillus thermoaerophilus]|nr:homoserine kinase [Paenibacillus thermoaerophilus]
MGMRNGQAVRPEPGARVRVRVPASTANLGPGFDALGMALNLYAYVELTAVSGESVVRLHGDNLDGVPTDKSNLVYEIAQRVFRRAGIECPELAINIASDIPLTRGLGSSASAIVGALVAANALIGSPLSDDELFQMATAEEGHPDNVGAALFGGIVAAFWDGERAEYVKIPADPRLQALVAIPRFQLSTEKARHALPKQVPMRDAVFNVGHSSLLVAAFCQGRLDLIGKAMKDALHQPYRAALIPGMERVLAEAADHGAVGVALSGAGPTLLVLVERDSPRKEELESFLIDTLRREGVEADTMWLSPEADGAVVLSGETADASRPFEELVTRRSKGGVRA